MTIFQAIILAIIEGLTEYLPVSSTGHMIIGAAVLGIADHPFTKIFEVNIQFGAILAVLVLYWKKFLQSFDFYKRLFVAFIPAAIIGFILDDLIDSLLGNVMVVAVSLLLGGIVLLFIDKWLENNENKEIPTYKNSFIIGLFQCLAMVPGVSRSAATIIGGMVQGLNRKSAAEFSFFLAVPTMAGASALKLLKGYMKGNLNFSRDEILLLTIGNLVGFIVAILAIKFFIGFLQKHGFKVFGYYRIALGIILITLLLSGYNLKLI
jgi:undecaprenyl-diphosphatase